jgi:hypothetical protein
MNNDESRFPGLWAMRRIKNPNEEWPSRSRGSTRGAKKEKFGFSDVFETFVFFCGQNAFLPSTGRLNFRPRRMIPERAFCIVIRHSDFVILPVAREGAKGRRQRFGSRKIIKRLTPYPLFGYSRLCIAHCLELSLLFSAFRLLPPRHSRTRPKRPLRPRCISPRIRM